MQENVHESPGSSMLDASLCPTVEKNVLNVFALVLYMAMSFIVVHKCFMLFLVLFIVLV